MESALGDGVSDYFYHLLWKKEGPFREKLNINIPDTVILRNGEPVKWYFTDDKGIVFKKKRVNSTLENITKTFLNKTKHQQIVAYFISLPNKDFYDTMAAKKNIKSYNLDSEKDWAAITDSTTEYYDAVEFEKTWSTASGCAGKTGILQRFIYTYNPCHEIIQVTWASQIATFTRKVNLQRLNDQRFGIYEKAITFDGPEFCARNLPLRGKHIPNRIRSKCEEIYKHIRSISFMTLTLSKMVAYFKVDPDSNIWFLWTSSVRIETPPDEKALHIGNPISMDATIRAPRSELDIGMDVTKQSSKLYKKTQCAICMKRVELRVLVPIRYGLLIYNEEIIERDRELHAHEMTTNTHGKINTLKGDEATEMDLVGIPWFITKAYPKISIKQYEMLKQDQEFLHQTIKGCDECYLIATRYLHKSSHGSTAKPQYARAISAVPNEILHDAQTRDVGPNSEVRKQLVSGARTSSSNSHRYKVSTGYPVKPLKFDFGSDPESLISYQSSKPTTASVRTRNLPLMSARSHNQTSSPTSHGRSFTSFFDKDSVRFMTSRGVPNSMDFTPPVSATSRRGGKDAPDKMKKVNLALSGRDLIDPEDEADKIKKEFLQEVMVTTSSMDSSIEERRRRQKYLIWNQHLTQNVKLPNYKPYMDPLAKDEEQLIQGQDLVKLVGDRPNKRGGLPVPLRDDNYVGKADAKSNLRLDLKIAPPKEAFENYGYSLTTRPHTSHSGNKFKTRPLMVLNRNSRPESSKTPSFAESDQKPIIIEPKFSKKRSTEEIIALVQEPIKETIEDRTKMTLENIEEDV